MRERERERERGGGVAGVTRDELENELAGRSTLNQRHTGVLGSECVLVDVNRQDEGKSAHLCL